MPDSTDQSSNVPEAQDFSAQHLQTTGQQQMAMQPESSHQLDAYGRQQVTDGDIVPNAHQQVTRGPISQLPVNIDQRPPQAPVSKDPPQTAPYTLPQTAPYMLPQTVPYTPPYMLPRQCGLCSAGLANIAGLRTHWANIHEGFAPYKCTGCGREFEEYSEARSHVVSSAHHKLEFCRGGHIEYVLDID